MAGLLSGLASLGLEHLENMELFTEEKGKEKKASVEKIEKVSIDESQLIYDKRIVCPVCGKAFFSKVMKTGRAKLLSTDWDLRPIYEGIDANKYGVTQCTYCGYAALSNSFSSITDTQRENIRKMVSSSVVLSPYIDNVYEYQDAIERYKLCLASAVVKKVKNSEKAYICLKYAWLYRGYAESLTEEDQKEELKKAKQQELVCIQNAYKGFVTARSTESYPMCGMDSATVDYLIAALAVHLKKYDIAEKLLSSLLTTPGTNKRTKDKIRDLMELMKEQKAKNV